ncbi:Galactose oxidase [Rhizoctonia solani]|uniref:Galactose oxidase n=1 Tax=Rhizoctonia solani TaxID=456999 RepID=A0A8H7H2J4_9AGAM|nr:Galactose oxidase [Rhizoctonia solani]
MTSRASTKQSPYEHPASSSSKASTRSHRECERECEDPRSSQRYIVDPHLFQMSKSVMASPTVSLSRAPVSGMLPTRHLRAHSMTLVDSTIWIFGGSDETDSREDVYTLDTETLVWGKPKPTGEQPPGSRAHTATLVHNRFIFIVGGGQVHVYFDTAGEWDRSPKRHRAKAPPPSGYHTSNLVENVMGIRRTRYVRRYLGHGSGGYGADTGSWKQVLTDEWFPCMFHSSTQLGSYSLILGGHNGQYETKQCAGRTLPARGYHSVVLADSRLVVTGGFDGEAIFDDVSILDLAALAYLPQVTRFGIIIDQQGVYVEDEGTEYREDGYSE